jgi:hypothetical protein
MVSEVIVVKAAYVDPDKNPELREMALGQWDNAVEAVVHAIGADMPKPGSGYGAEVFHDLRFGDFSRRIGPLAVPVKRAVIHSDEGHRRRIVRRAVCGPEPYGANADHDPPGV